MSDLAEPPHPKLVPREVAEMLRQRALGRAATLIGAAEAMMAAHGAAWPPDERPHYERTDSTLAGAMGDADFENAHARGQTLATHQAVELALAATPPDVR